MVMVGIHVEMVIMMVNINKRGFNKRFYNINLSHILEMSEMIIYYGDNYKCTMM